MWDAENIFIKNPEKLGTVLIGRMSPIAALLFICTCIGVLGIQFVTALQALLDNLNILTY
jgi:CobQ-like glutamine amidotransferase family enzyme